MRKIAIASAVMLALTLVNSLVESRRTCDCPPACWCKRPVLKNFRWVLPLGHLQRGR